METIKGQLIENQIFTETPDKFIACNIVSCEFSNAENTTFERCNVETSIYHSTSKFSRCNLIKCELVEGSTYDRTNIIDEDEPEPEPELEEEMNSQE